MGKRCFADIGHRCWMEVTFEEPPSPRRRVQQVTKRLIADLGCPFEFVIDPRTLHRIQWREEKSQLSNYGWLEGAIVRTVMPEVEFDQFLLAYANRRVVQIARKEGFDGLAGKPFLDHFHFHNGNGGELCLESWAQYRMRCTREPSEQQTG
ncbi:hypothetical protein FJZ31_26695 [Candidatus Poribacteria bacterium]|nr:hypothetical protein [Candidatus Poribacteria bacterium]